MSDFNLRVVEGSPHRVFVAGDIDFATARRVTELLCELSGDIEVDCEEVTFIDTAGFDALDWGYVVATARGPHLRRGWVARLPSACRGASRVCRTGATSRADVRASGERAERGLCSRVSPPIASFAYREGGTSAEAGRMREGPRAQTVQPQCDPERRACAVRRALRSGHGASPVGAPGGSHGGRAGRVRCG